MLARLQSSDSPHVLAAPTTLAMVATTEAPVQAPVEAPEERTRTLDELLPPYRVVLHNDDVNDMMHVVRALLESVPELSSERAVEIMLAAHLHGSAEVIVCYLERAELYRNRLEAHGLTATIERA
jgi:ATP-dependent Clp protease adaptor protein ClpS